MDIFSFRELDARRCLLLAIQDIIHYISLHGDGDIPQNKRWEYGTAEFVISRSSGQPPPFLSYNDTIAIIAAFSMKAGQIGYRHIYGEIVLTEDGETLSDAILSHAT